ncbi:MAG: protein kinase, partial [Actinomycetota bacterium]|nr:protein kinase [Actinomycetota bacterium]
VAVKVIKPWWAEDPAWVKSFEREAQLLASISDPGIVQIFDVGVAAEGLYYVAELVHGESLAKRLQRGRLAPASARGIALQLCQALARAHAGRVVHRDVKPENVLISRDGRVKVGDFGVARLAEGSSDGAATIAGTPRYMAPEQARGGAISPATDVYGVGVVLYEMLAGHPPFDGHSAVELALRHVGDPPPPLPGEVPADLAEVVERALAKAPGERYRDGAEMAAALARCGGKRVGDPAADAELPGGGAQAEVSRGPAPTRVGDPMSPRRNLNPPERRQRLALFALVLALALALVAGAIALAPGHVKVPDLHGLSATQLTHRLTRAGLRAQLSSRPSPTVAPEVEISQAPDAGVSVSSGTAVRVQVSSGPPPVSVPTLRGAPVRQARTTLAALNLRAAVSEAPVPGVRTGVVVAQAPDAGALLAPGGTVALTVPSPPQWRALTAFAGQAAGSSVAFRIRGRRWRLLYSMRYQGTCTFVFVCSGPSAQVIALRSGETVDGFDLSDGSGQSRELRSAPGLYQVRVRPGSDTARWSIKVQDRY